jgi:hypothetical protein
LSPYSEVKISPCGRNDRIDKSSHSKKILSKTVYRPGLLYSRIDLTTALKKCCDSFNNRGSTTVNENNNETLRTTIRGEIGVIAWKELARFFASGTAVAVDAELSLADVACQFAQNSSGIVEQWMRHGKVGRVSDEQAKIWFETDATVAAVVVSPWVLVQEVQMESEERKRP